VGGRISYSTCSLNPVEDEAVVAAALKQYAGCIELVKVELPGFTFRQGMQDWKVMTEKLNDTDAEGFFKEFKRFEDVEEAYMKKRCIKETMFASFYSEDIKKELTKCLRVFPHD
jgi:16S rRNA C967 or C1407 C5-methylase (RsmB/RsmF family)